MQFVQVPAAEAHGALLGASIFTADGRKLWGKGHEVEAADVDAMASQGIDRVWIIRLDSEETPEAEVALRLASHLVSGPVNLRSHPGGRVSAVASASAVLGADADALARINSSGLAVAATAPQWSIVPAGEIAAVVKSRPFGVPAAAFSAWLSDEATRPAPVQLRPLPAQPRVTVIFSDPIRASRATSQLGDATCRRLTAFDARLTTVAIVEEVGPLTAALRTHASANPDLIIVASTHAPADLADPIGQSIVAAGGRIANFMAPVDPGSLLLLGYLGPVPVVTCPGSLRNLQPCVLDRILPPLLAGFVLSSREIAAWGLGGLNLGDVPWRRFK